MVLDSQNIPGPSFIGTLAESRQLRQKTRFSPDAIGLHLDGGNTRVSDWDAPLGKDPKVHSRSIGLSVQYWHDDGRLTARIICEDDTGNHYCMAALDPQNLEVLATWSPANKTLLSPYGMVTDRTILMPLMEGAIIELERVESTNGTLLTRLREINIAPVLPKGFIVLSCLYDGDGYVWFSAVRLLKTGTTEDSGIIGYIGDDDTVHIQQLDNQAFENSMAVDGTTVYVNSGPLGNGTDTGYMYAFQAAANGDVQTLWLEEYPAQKALKPGGLSLGSGSTPTLVGDKYVAMTDNAPQVNVRIYRRSAQDEKGLTDGSRLVCQVPIFDKDGSANENALLGYYDGSTYSVVANNHYGGPEVQSLDTMDDINGDFNNFTPLYPGITRIDISEDGNCTIRWDLRVRSTSVVSLSTANGLLYSYTQDEQLAMEGEYIWYFTAIDFSTGEIVWRVRSGAGGTFNNNMAPTQISPSGMLYQLVIGGVAWLQG